MKIFVIAEIGINHNGDLEIAKKLIDIANESGCDAVKFQKRTIDLVYSEDLLNSERKSLGQHKENKKKDLNLTLKNIKKLITTVNRRKLIGLLQLGILKVKIF